jgi:hypothetical protein
MMIRKKVKRISIKNKMVNSIQASVFVKVWLNYKHCGQKPDNVKFISQTL